MTKVTRTPEVSPWSVFDMENWKSAPVRTALVSCGYFLAAAGGGLAARGILRANWYRQLAYRFFPSVAPWLRPDIVFVDGNPGTYAEFATLIQRARRDVLRAIERRAPTERRYCVRLQNGIMVRLDAQTPRFTDREQVCEQLYVSIFNVRDTLSYSERQRALQTFMDDPLVIRLAQDAGMVLDRNSRVLRHQIVFRGDNIHAFEAGATAEFHNWLRLGGPFEPRPALGDFGKWLDAFLSAHKTVMDLT